MASFAADFLGGLNQGLGRGMDMYSQLQQMANAQRQMQLQEAQQQRLMQAQEAQAQQDKVTTIVNVAKMKDPKTRKTVMSTLGPQLGFSPDDPQFTGLLDALGSEDTELLKLIQGAGQEAGVPPNMTALLGRADPDVAAQQLFGYQRGQQNNDIAQMRIEMGLQRLFQQAQGQQGTQNRFEWKQTMDQLRALGLIPEMGTQPTTNPFAQLQGMQGGGAAPALSQQGDLRPLTGAVPRAEVMAVPGSSAARPSDTERGVAGSVSEIEAAEQRALAWTAQNSDYLGSTGAQVDKLLKSDKSLGGIGALAGGTVGLAGSAAMGGRHLGGAVLGGTSMGASAGYGLQEWAAETFTSAKGREFQSVWEPVLDVAYAKSGKALTASEWARSYREFVPSPNDSPEALRIKQENRSSVLKNLRIQAGRAAPLAGSPTSPQAPALGLTQIQTLGQKYRSGQASPAEVEQLKEALRALGKNVR